MSNDSSPAYEEELDSSLPVDVTRESAAEGGARRNLRVPAISAAAVLAVAIGVGTYVGTQQSHPAAHGTSLAAAGTDAYEVFVAAQGGDEVATFNTQTAAAGSYYEADSPAGIALSPDDSTLYVAETGQYAVLAFNVSTRAVTTIHVGAYPQDVAASPNGTTVYATLTGGDTGPGGSNQVAVIDAATNTVTGYITVGTSPRQIVLNATGTRVQFPTEQLFHIDGTPRHRWRPPVEVVPVAEEDAVLRRGRAVLDRKSVV